MHCSECGKALSEAAKFCKYCGSPVVKTGYKREISIEDKSLQRIIKKSPLTIVLVITVVLVVLVIAVVCLKGETLNTDIVKTYSLSGLRGSGVLVATCLWPTTLICALMLALLSQSMLWQKNDIEKKEKAKMSLVMLLIGLLGICTNIAMLIDILSVKQAVSLVTAAILSVPVVFFLTIIFFVWKKPNFKLLQIGILIQSVILILASVRGSMTGDLGFFITGNGFALPFSSLGLTLVSPLDSTLYFMIRLLFGISGMFGFFVFIKSILGRNG